jgi:hypothetical protein
MCAFGQETEIEQQVRGGNQVTATHLRKLTNDVAESTKPTVTAGLQMAVGLKKPEKMDFEPPELKRPKPDAIAFVKTPMNVTMLLDSIKSSIRFDNGNVTLDFDKAREDFNKIAKKAFTTEQTEELFKYVLAVFSKKLADTSVEKVQDFYKEKASKAERDAAMSLGKESAVALSKIGIGTLVDNQKELLKRYGEGLTEQQRIDMLRGALGAGFSAPAVFSTAAEFGGRQKSGRSRETETDFIEKNTMMPVLLQESMRVANQLNDQVRLARRNYEKDDSNEKYKAEYQAAYAQLANFMGGEGSTKRLLALGDEEKGVIVDVLTNHLNASMALHSGRTDEVVPTKAPRQRAA